MYCFISYKLIIDVHEDTKVAKIVSEGCVTCKWTSKKKNRKAKQNSQVYDKSLLTYKLLSFTHSRTNPRFSEKILSSENLNLEIFTYILYCLTFSWSHSTSLSTNKAYTLSIYSYILMYIEDIKLFPHISSLLIYDHLTETHVSFVEEIVVYSHCKL